MRRNRKSMLTEKKYFTPLQLTEGVTQTVTTNNTSDSGS